MQPPTTTRPRPAGPGRTATLLALTALAAALWHTATNSGDVLEVAPGPHPTHQNGPTT